MSLTIRLSPIDSVALTTMRPPKSAQKGQVLDPSWTLEFGVNPLDGTNYLDMLGSPKIQDTRVVQASRAPSLASDGHMSEY